MTSLNRQPGFTLIEIAIVLLIITLLLGYTVALFPRQQELRQYKTVEREMDQVIDAIIGFAQVNGRLPCPAGPNSVGSELGGGAFDCTNFGGFVPVSALGIQGGLNADSLLLDPWGNPYRYYVTNSDANGANGSDFVRNQPSIEMRVVGLVDVQPGPADGYIDLDGQYVVCDQTDATLNDLCDAPAVTVFGNPAGGGGPYAGAPFVLVSHGKNWREGAAVGDELANMGATLSTALTTPMANGPAGRAYLLKDVEAGQTTFVRRGFSDNFDDVVKWGSPNILFSKMIEAGQLP